MEFYKDFGLFFITTDLKMLYEALSEHFYHLKTQAAYGCKLSLDGKS
jgi:hypothetical protein